MDLDLYLVSRNYKQLTKKTLGKNTQFCVILQISLLQLASNNDSKFIVIHKTKVQMDFWVKPN